MGRRPVTRVATGVAVATVALTSVFAGTAWAPRVHTGLADEKALCKAEASFPALGFDTRQECFAAAKVAKKLAKAAAKAER